MSVADSTDSGRGVYVPKPKADIYTVMLGIALGAIVFACLLLILELAAFDWDIKGEGARVGFAPLHGPVYAAAPSNTSVQIV
ncbi:MAG: hypothetical protein HY000_27095 [Planctomycetes bacterium]|nr:hypothetical protein [Planctomycetota bacterium]